MASESEGEGRLSDVRVFLYKEYPESNAAMAGFGMCYVNYMTPQQQQRKLSGPVYFWRYALVEGDYSTLAKQVLGTLSGDIISPRTQELVAQDFSDHMHRRFYFIRFEPGLQYLPMLVFVLDIIVHDEYDPNREMETETETETEVVVDYYDCFYLAPCRTTLRPGDDYDEAPGCGMAKYAVDLQVAQLGQQQVEEDSSVDDFYQILDALWSSSLYSQHLQHGQQQDPNNISREAKHAVVALAVANQTLIMLKPSFKLIPPKDLGQDDTNCSICLDNIHVAATKFVLCNHVFHTDCIVKWLSKHQSCPYCRSNCLVRLFT